MVTTEARELKPCHRRNDPHIERSLLLADALCRQLEAMLAAHDGACDSELTDGVCEACQVAEGARWTLGLVRDSLDVACTPLSRSKMGGRSIADVAAALDVPESALEDYLPPVLPCVADDSVCVVKPA